MEAAAAGALYAAETVAEGAYALVKGLTYPTAPVRTTFYKLKAPSLPRSSHTISVVHGRAYIFGGEIKPREPVPNDVDVLVLPVSGNPSIVATDHFSVPAKPASPSGPVPEARVGHSAAVLGHHVLIFGGRGGKSMTALEEKGRVWAFDTRSHTWSYLDPNPASPYPSSRSYHTSVASEHPLPKSDPSTINVLKNDPPTLGTTPIPEPAPEFTFGTMLVHAGCPSAGGRTSDLWAFDIASRSWAELPSAPDPPRGGTSIALVRDRLYRFGGFDGERELGGAVDYLDLRSDTFSDKAGKGEMSLATDPRGWQTNAFAVGSENKGGPTNRSVAGLVPVSTGQGRDYLLIICGETSPSSLGHDGAGKFLDDVWSFQLRPEGATAASVKDAVRGPLLGKDTGERDVVKCKAYDGEKEILIQEGQPKPMKGRGWFASASVGADVGHGTSVVVHGGLEEGNSRLGDTWLIEVS